MSSLTNPCATQFILGLFFLAAQVVAPPPLPQPVTVTKNEILGAIKSSGLDLKQDLMTKRCPILTKTAIAANGALQSYYADIQNAAKPTSGDTNTNTLRPSVVVFAGTGTLGAIGLKSSAQWCYAEYDVHAIVFPRFKSELLKPEDDSENHNILDYYTERPDKIPKVTKLLHTWNAVTRCHEVKPSLASVYNNIRATREAMEKIYRPLVAKENSSLDKAIDDARENPEVQACLAKLNEAFKVAGAELVQELETALKGYKEKEKLLLIEAFVGAGFVHESESKDVIIWREIAVALIDVLNDFKKIQNRKNEPVATIASFDPPCYTDPRHGYIHVSRDGNKTVSRIQTFYIPDVIIYIHVPRESLLARDCAIYQLAGTKAVYIALATFSDLKKQSISMADHFYASLDQKRLDGQDEVFKTFFEAMKTREQMEKLEDRYLKVQWPLPSILKSTAYVPEIFPQRDDLFEYYIPTNSVGFV